jgi:hypothetical protein
MNADAEKPTGAVMGSDRRMTLPLDTVRTSSFGYGNILYALTKPIFQAVLNRIMSLEGQWELHIGPCSAG